MAIKSPTDPKVGSNAIGPERRRKHASEMLFCSGCVDGVKNKVRGESE